jgi:ElaB/YqjD/DUF883 family membrane-anchored ribosome-binding protein
MAEGEDEVKWDAGDAGRPRSEEIREEIEETRIELEETVDAIGEKLSLRRIAQEGWQAVKNTSENSGNRLVRAVREHPIPMGLIGVGVTWLVIESRRRSSEDWSAYPAGHEDYSEFEGRGGYEGAGRAMESARGKLADAKAALGDAANRVSDSASDAAHRVAEAARGAGERVGGAASVVKDRAADLGRRTTRSVRRARDGYWDLVERRPLAAGVATLAAGLLVGLLVPSTSREDELMGDTRDELLGRARDASRETLEKTKDVARSAVDAAQDAAKNAARDEARRQNLKL